MGKLRRFGKTEVVAGLGLILVLAFGKLQAQSGEIGPHCGKSIVSVNGAGQVWQAASEARCDDNDSKTFTNPLVKGDYTQYLQVKDFGFKVPESAQIQGIEMVLIRRSDLQGGVIDRQVQLCLGNRIVGSDMRTSDIWSNEWIAAYYGGEDSNWGTNLRPELVNSPGFGCVIQVENIGQTARPEIDEVLLTVYYSMPGNLWYMVKSSKSTATPVCTAL